MDMRTVSISLPGKALVSSASDEILSNNADDDSGNYSALFHLGIVNHKSSLNRV